jgi:ferritin-like protein
MAGASQGYHEPVEDLGAETLERHRAVVSIIEEFEAADWYNQRVDATSDDALRAILANNRDEEKEHAVMLLEWWRRRDPVLDKHLRAYLFTDAPITEIEAVVEAAEAGDTSLAIGSLHGEAVA